MVSVIFSHFCHLSSVICRLFYSIVITHHIAIGNDWNAQVFLELVDSGKISMSSEGLFVGSSMYGDKIGSGVLESGTEFDEILPVFPAESSFYRYWDFYRLAHFFDDFECRVRVDHEARSMSAFDDFFCWAAHIYIDASDSITFDEDGSLSKHLRIFSEDLDDKRLFYISMWENLSAKSLAVYETIGTIEFRKCDNIRCDRFDDLSIRRIGITIHRCECCDR